MKTSLSIKKLLKFTLTKCSKRPNIYFIPVSFQMGVSVYFPPPVTHFKALHPLGVD